MSYTLNGRIIEAITVDFWSTIAYDGTFDLRREKRGEILFEWLKGRNETIDLTKINEIQKEFSKLWMTKWLDFQTTLDAADFVNFFCEKVDLTLDSDSILEISNLLDEALLAAPPTPINGVIDALKKLSEHFPMALISDTGISSGKSMTRLLDGWGLNGILDRKVLSNEVGAAKPNPLMFKKAEEILEIPRHRIVHIGDTEQTDIQGAKSFGMAAIRFDGSDLTIPNCKKCSMADFVSDSWDDISKTLLSE
jgi:putative hydrolase of the HAD superfamily